MGAGNETGGHRGRKRPIEPYVALSIDARYLPSDAAAVGFAEHAGEFARPQFLMRLAEQVDSISSLLEVTRDRFTHVTVISDEAVEQSGRNADLLSIEGDVVLHRVLAGDARQSVGAAHILQRPIGAHQLRQFVLPIRGFLADDGVGPAEVVQTSDHVEVDTDAHCVAQRLIDARRHHRIGVDVRIAWRDAARYDRTSRVTMQWGDDRSISGRVVVHAAERLDDRLSDDLVVVGAHPPLLARHIGARHQARQHITHSLGIHVREVRGIMNGRNPLAHQFQLWQPVVEEL